MNKSLVAYFSATGTTEGAANALAKAARADLYRITPAQPYSSRDLNWNNSSSRSSVEMGNDSARPALAQVAPDLSPYDVVFVGFPIWWYVEPRIVDTFLESCDLSGKAVVPFATSGSSGITRAASRMRDIVPQARVLDGRMMNDRPSTSELEAWIRGLGL
ncbi:flavodoxin [Tractidigestivibacter sp.]|jgi:flavodoxin|uniref:flavodoxin n=1 Tax=Tractidigestivibacter sp. TaxID=2847320 RepID=UPI003FD8AC7E